LGSSGGEDAARVILQTLGLNGTEVRLYFVKGSPALDPVEFDLDFEGDGLIFRTLGKCASLSVDGVKVTALHGMTCSEGCMG